MLLRAIPKDADARKHKSHPALDLPTAGNHFGKS